MLVSHIGEFRLQDKLDEKLSSAHTGYNLPRSQTELYIKHFCQRSTSGKFVAVYPFNSPDSVLGQSWPNG